MKRLYNVVTVFCAVLSVATADYRDDALNLHNQYRLKHGAQPLILSSKLNAVAQKWAQSMADSNNMKHSSGPYGENLSWSSNTNLGDSPAAIQATKSWYDEIKKYILKPGAFSMATGHFTQVVWKNTRSFRIGVARSRTGGGVFVCANYDPPGNYAGQFIQNVKT